MRIFYATRKVGTRRLATAAQSFLQLKVLDRFTSAARERRESNEIFLYERLCSLVLTLKSCVVPSRHPLQAIAANVRCKIDSRELTSNLDVLRLIDDLVIELTPPAPPIDPKKSSKPNFIIRFGRWVTSRFRKEASEPVSRVRFVLPDPATGEQVLEDVLAAHYSELRSYGTLSAARQYASWGDDLPRASQPRPERGYELEWQFTAQTILRVALLRDYLVKLREALTRGDLPEGRLLGDLTMSRLADATLLGSSSERLWEHLKLYGDELAPGALQDALYTLYEPEVQVALAAFSAPAEFLPDNLKKLPKNASVYLLDRFELNVKARCIIAWTNTNFNSNDELPAKVSLEKLLAVRAQYFDVCLAVAHQFAQDCTADRRLLHHDRKEWSESFRNGLVFIVIVGTLDHFIQSL